MADAIPAVKGPDHAARGLVVLLVVLALANAASAHNPALTVYEPAQLGSDLLVLGEEGTAARLTLDGEVLWARNGTGHVLQAPVANGGLAATVVQDVETLRLMVVAFDEDGEVWRTSLPPDATRGLVIAHGDGFAVFTSAGRVHILEPTEGRAEITRELPAPPSTTPVALAGDGWAFPGPRWLAWLDEDGKETARSLLDGLPVAVAATDGAVVVAVRASTLDQDVALLAIGPDQATRWARRVPGFTVGGSIAVLSDGTVAVGTYDPEGASVTVVRPSGEPVWEIPVAPDTAAAAGAGDGRVYVAVNSGVLAFNAEDGTRMWNASSKPRIASPVVIGGLVFASSAEDRLVALDAVTGETQWTWSDDVGQVPWTDEQLAQRPPSMDETPIGWWVSLVALAVVVLVRRARGC